MPKHHQRNQVLDLVEAATAPKTALQIEIALSLPAHLSPYREKMEEWIRDEVELAVFFNELHLLCEMGREQEAVRREKIMHALLDEKSSEQLTSKQAFQFTEETPKRIRERSEELIELQYKVTYLEKMLVVERPRLEGYQNEIKLQEQMVQKIDSNWMKRHRIQADKYCSKFDLPEYRLHFSLTPEMKNRLKEAFILPPPGKLIKLNQDVIKEAFNDQGHREKIATTMASKGCFVRNLKALDVLGSIRFAENKLIEKGVVEEHVIKPSSLVALSKKIPPMPSVQAQIDKMELVTALTADHKRAVLQDKIDKVYRMEKALNHLHDRIKTLESQPAPPHRPMPKKG